MLSEIGRCWPWMQQRCLLQSDKSYPTIQKVWLQSKLLFPHFWCVLLRLSQSTNGVAGLGLSQLLSQSALRVSSMPQTCGGGFGSLLTERNGVWLRLLLLEPPGGCIKKALPPCWQEYIYRDCVSFQKAAGGGVQCYWSQVALAGLLAI